MSPLPCSGGMQREGEAPPLPSRDVKRKAPLEGIFRVTSHGLQVAVSDTPTPLSDLFRSTRYRSPLPTPALLSRHLFHQNTETRKHSYAPFCVQSSINRRTSSIIRVPLSAQADLNLACSSGGRSMVSLASFPVGFSGLVTGAPSPPATHWSSWAAAGSVRWGMRNGVLLMLV